jgi:hypothetical protein
MASAFRMLVSGDTLIRLYGRYSHTPCLSHAVTIGGVKATITGYALVKRGEQYRVAFYPKEEVVVIDSSTVKKVMPGTITYSLVHPHSTFTPTYWVRTQGDKTVALSRGVSTRLQDLPRPLEGEFIVAPQLEDEMDGLLAEEGYVPVCRVITKDNFPDMYDRILGMQARKEALPSMQATHLVLERTFPQIPPELNASILRWIERRTVPERGGGRIVHLPWE